ncbi:hypothetical protein [Streptomyces sp. NPDC049585]|uniref:hypothetical protein n=1 Tax=Streptomyces sp. NPDC049585 TaxID=3155154 RepID=UPI0034213E20
MNECDGPFARLDVEAAAQNHAEEHARSDSALLTEEEESRARELDFSAAQVAALSAAGQERLYEDAKGFYIPDEVNSGVKPVARQRVVGLAVQGLLDPQPAGPGRRLLVLTDEGRDALALWERAHRAGHVTPAAKDSKAGIPARQRRAYTFVSDGL